MVRDKIDQIHLVFCLVEIGRRIKETILFFAHLNWLTKLAYTKYHLEYLTKFTLFLHLVCAFGRFYFFLIQKVNEIPPLAFCLHVWAIYFYSHLEQLMLLPCFEFSLCVWAISFFPHLDQLTKFPLFAFSLRVRAILFFLIQNS